MEFSIDFGTLGSTRAQAPLYASEDGIVSALGNEECLFQSRRTGAVHPMTTQVLVALDRCRAFRTLDEHARVIMAAEPALRDKGDAVRRVLENLVQRGLMTSAEDFLGRLRAAPARVRPPVRRVAIRACDRPAALASMLRSIGADAATARREYVVLDDSRDAAALAANREAVAAARGAGLTVEHVDGTRWQASVEALAGAVPAAANAARAALSREGRPSGGGKAMNFAALLGAGAQHGLLDEDFLFPLRRHPEAQGPIALTLGADLPARFFDDVEAALAAGTPLEEDPYDYSARWCGQHLGAALGAEPPDATTLREVEPSRLRFDADSRIAAVCHGHRGSSGTAGADWLFLLDAESRAGFWREREAYLRHLDAGAVWFGPRRARVLEFGHFTPFLIDGSRLCAPTRAGGRSEDLLFGMTTRLADPRAVVWHTPASIGHRQEAPRRRSAALRHPDTPGVNAFLVDWLGSALDTLRAESPAARLGGAAALLRDLAAASSKRRIETLEEYLRFRRADLVRSLQQVQAQAKDAPVYWLADLREIVTVNGRALMQRDPPRLADWPQDLDAEGCARHLAAELEDFASVLEGWPALWAHAAEREGDVLARA